MKNANERSKNTNPLGTNLDGYLDQTLSSKLIIEWMPINSDLLELLGQQIGYFFTKRFGDNLEANEFEFCGFCKKGVFTFPLMN